MNRVADRLTSMHLHRCMTGLRCLGFAAIVFSLGLAARAAAKEEDRVQAELERVEKMNPADQQAWLQQLEQRAAKIAKQTLSPKEAERYQARVHAMLHQKTVTWAVLREVVGDIQTREKAPDALKTNAAKQTVVAKPQAGKASGRTRAATNAKPQATRRGGTTVKVDVEELEAQIAACNLALREVEAELAEKSGWTAAKLESAFDRLKTTVVCYRDLSLFRDLVPKDQRAEMTKLEAPKSAISQLAARVPDARKRAKSDKFVGDDIERKAELTRIDVVAHGIEELAGK